MEPRRGGVCGQGGGGRKAGAAHLPQVERDAFEFSPFGVCTSMHLQSTRACICNLHHGLGKKEGICLHVIGARPTVLTTGSQLGNLNTME
ncbi:unnamed protein product [Sphagnum troendelagicum]|uniref:Uncharacterized protein n=1 Tax=Sphagnum troendelagicum TaxID=128251 RepID=A0ABP0TM26_9BRYO